MPDYIQFSPTPLTLTSAKKQARYPSSPEVQIHVFLVFRSLTFNRGDNQRYVVQLGVVTHAMDTLRKYDDRPDVLAAGFMLLQNVTVCGLLSQPPDVVLWVLLPRGNGEFV